MTLVTTDDGPSGLSTSLALLEEQLSMMKEDLEALQKSLRAGNTEDLKNSSRTLSDIRQWMRIALEAEMNLEKRKKQEKGIVGGYALDFDAARASIGCRLDRLRRARCPRRISGQSGAG